MASNNVKHFDFGKDINAKEDRPSPERQLWNTVLYYALTDLEGFCIGARAKDSKDYQAKAIGYFTPNNPDLDIVCKNSSFEKDYILLLVKKIKNKEITFRSENSRGIFIKK